MPIGPTPYFGKEKVFVDRELCIQAFRENIQESGTQKYNVLFYYGIAGIGKSKLQKELQRILDEEQPEIVWACIDLNTKIYREVGTFLITLRNKIQEKCKVKFYLFNTIHAIYWKKLHPEIPLPKENYPIIEEEGFFGKIIDVLDQFGPARLISDIINNASDNIRNFFKDRTIDIDKLTAMEAHELEKLLPVFFAADFTSYLGTDSKAYIFIDTYEALWDGLRNKGSFHEKDKWIRDDLIPNMPGVSWIICGREKLLWDSECDSEWKMYLEQHPVDELPESYCTKFLKLCGVESKDIRSVIIKASEGVPYYLNLSIDTYEQIITSKKRHPVPDDFGKTQPDIFEIFVKYLYSNEIRALEILSVPNFWDRNLFEILMKKFDTGLPTGAFLELIKFSFIKKDADGKCSIHQLMRKSLQEHQDLAGRKSVHEFMFEYYRDKLKEIDIKAITQEHETILTEAFYHAKKALETTDLLIWFIAASDPFDIAAFWQLIAPMYEEILQILEKILGPKHPEVATTQDKLAGLYNNMGDYEKALPLYQGALDIREKVLGPEHPDVAITLDNLARLYNEMGEYDKALPLYQRALDIREKVLGPEHPDIAATLNNLAELYESMGKYKKALPLCQRSLNIREKMLGPQHPNVANSLNNLALLYRQMGDYEKALSLYQRALDIREKVLGPNNPDVATTLNSLAFLYRQMGKYKEALPLCLRALDIREKVLGPKHPYVAITLNNLTGLYYQMGDYDKALPLCQRSLDIREKVLDSQHPNVANSLYNLAGIYEIMGDYEKALSLYQRALDIREKVLGPEHPNVATTLNSLAFLYRQMGNYEKALPLCLRALNIREKVLGLKHPFVANSLNNLAGLYYQMGDYGKALPLCQRSLDIREKVLDLQHPNVANSLNTLAEIYQIMRDYEKALSVFQRALDIREKVLDPKHLDIANSLNNLAGLYNEMGDYEKALPLYQRALDIREKVLGTKHPDVATTLNSLEFLYRQMGNYEKALPLYQRIK